MKQRRRTTKTRATRVAKPGQQSARSSAGRKTAAKKAARKRKGLKSRLATGKRPYASFAETLKFYKPIKKPVTLRLDADVLAWFKREGRRYQTRINSALRKLMEREMERRRQ